MSTATDDLLEPVKESEKLAFVLSGGGSLGSVQVKSLNHPRRAAHAGRIYDRLEGHFGQQSVFMDVDTIEPGLDFVEAVRGAVGSCDALIAVIGMQWLEITDGTGRRRLDNPEDLVRLEIATALSRNIRVIPVLGQGARMPLAADLPEGLKALARRNSLEISDARFRSDVDRLIEVLQAPTPEVSPPPGEGRSCRRAHSVTIRRGPKSLVAALVLIHYSGTIFSHSGFEVSPLLG